MIMLLVAMLFASNAAANSENAHMCSALDDYYTQKIYDGIIGYPCYKVTEINDNMIGIMGRSDDYRSNDNFRHYTIAESSEYMMVIYEHENVVKRIRNGERAFTRAIGGENVKNIYKGENGFLFVCEENGKIILKKINRQGETDVIDYI